MHGWQLVSPGAVEYWPVGQALHASPLLRYPALHCLHAGTQEQPAHKKHKHKAYQGQVFELGVVAPHEMY